MFKNIKHNFLQKSLLQRFLFFIGVLFLIAYFVLGCIFIFWKDMPVELTYTRRLLFGILLIVYSIFRFYRIVSIQPDDE